MSKGVPKTEVIKSHIESTEQHPNKTNKWLVLRYQSFKGIIYVLQILAQRRIIKVVDNKGEP